MRIASYSIILMLMVFRAAAVEPDSLRKLSLKPAGDFDQRFSFIHRNSVVIWGYRVGALVNKKFKIGVGGYFLTHQFKGVRMDQYGQPVHLLNDFLGYGTVYVEPFLFRRESWEMSVLTEAGYGRSRLKILDNATGNLVQISRKGFVPIGVGLSASYKIPPLFGIRPLRWFGLNALVGYRKILFQQDVRTDYDGAYWSVGTAIFLDRILDDYRAWKTRRRARKMAL